MNTKLKLFVERHRKLLLTLGLAVILGGIALAYFTGDAEPWGTIGGIFSGIALFFTLIVGSSRRKQESK